jgi:hypothetical protein
MVPATLQAVTNQKRRTWLYVAGSCALLAVLAVFWAVEYYLGIVKRSALGDLFPEAVIALYVIVFEFAHRPANGETFAYERQLIGDPDGDGGIGVEEEEEEEK